MLTNTIIIINKPMLTCRQTHSSSLTNQGSLVDKHIYQYYHSHLLVHVFDEFVEVLVPGVSILILKVTPHGHHYVVGVEVLGLQKKFKTNC